MELHNTFKNHSLITFEVALRKMLTSRGKIFIGRFIQVCFDVKARTFLSFTEWNFSKISRTILCCFLFCFRQFQVALWRKMLSLRRTILIGMFIEICIWDVKEFFFSSLNGSFQNFYEPFCFFVFFN